MPQPQPRTACSTVLGPACLCVALAGCTYDWTVGPASVTDAGGAAGEAGQDAQLSPACQQLVDALAQARVTLNDCTPMAACVYPVTDECGCTFSVAQLFPSTDYGELVADFHDAGCTLPCDPCGPESVLFHCQENPDGAPAHCAPTY